MLPRVKVADGVIATAALADAATITPAIAPDAFQRVINEKYAADIMFLINQANIRANQLNTDAMQELQRQIRESRCRQIARNPRRQHFILCFSPTVRWNSTPVWPKIARRTLKAT